jgi:hypothetical protein
MQSRKSGSNGDYLDIHTESPILIRYMDTGYFYQLPYPGRVEFPGKRE